MEAEKTHWTLKTRKGLLEPLEIKKDSLTPWNIKTKNTPKINSKTPSKFLDQTIQKIPDNIYSVHIYSTKQQKQLTSWENYNLGETYGFIVRLELRLFAIILPKKFYDELKSKKENDDLHSCRDDTRISVGWDCVYGQVGCKRIAVNCWNDNNMRAMIVLSVLSCSNFLSQLQFISNCFWKIVGVIIGDYKR